MFHVTVPSKGYHIQLRGMLALRNFGTLEVNDKLETIGKIVLQLVRVKVGRQRGGCPDLLYRSVIAGAQIAPDCDLESIHIYALLFVLFQFI
uniref:HDC19053 n=1 Tax=Drosophila melanogaster TaxID=7227 RepID=Q6IIB9_DROME|nr:TPA_inf: HDC19053 [Drosophila melanogaster]